MKKGTLKNILISLFASLAIVSCGNNSEEVCGSDVEYETPVTDSFTFEHIDVLGNNNFLSATSGLAISEVTVSTFTDGDTTNFRLVSGGSTAFRVRYEGINTPESTGRIEERGIKASHFTKSKLSTAHRIVLVNDYTLFEKFDSSGGRYMGFVWYQPEENSEFRLLNLEIVEQGYSRNFLTQNSDILDGYYEAFLEAGDAAKGRRVNGERDCDFDTSGEIVETTIANAKDEFDVLGIDDSTASSGRTLRITGIVIALDGVNFYVRDVNLSDEDAVKSSIYAFTSYKSSGVKVGDVVRFYAKITKFYGNYQLTDVRINDPSYPFEILSSGEEECIALGYEYDIDPVALDPNAVMSDESLNDYQGNLVSTTVCIEDSENFVTSYINNSNVTVYTVHAYLNEYSIDIRLEGHSFFNSENAIKAVFESGKLYDVKVLVSFYKANEEDNGDYQLEFPSFRATEFRNYVSEHVEE